MLYRADPWLHVITGCMSSGKTDELLRLLRRAEFARRRSILVRPDIDDRTPAEYAESRSKARYPSVVVSRTEPAQILSLARERDADLVGIEAIRVLRPTMFEAIVSVADYLSARMMMPGQGGYQPGRSPTDTPIGPMVAVDAALAQDVCRWLFPGARHYIENMNQGSEWEGTWRRQRKIASASVFRFYLERQLPDGVVRARVVDAAVEHLKRRKELQSIVDSMSSAELLDLIERMNQGLEEIPVDLAALDKDPATVGLPVLMDLLERLPEETGMFRFGGSMVLTRAALGLLKRLPTPEARAEAVRSVLPQIRSLSARLILILVCGHREGVGNRLLVSEVATELENTLRSDLMALPAADFAKEPQTVRLAKLLAETPEGRTVLGDLAEDDRVMLSLFVGSVGDITRQAIGSVAVEVTKTLAWDLLAGYFGGDEEMLKRRTGELVEAVKSNAMTISDEEREALRLALDYATGNRPETSFDRIMRIQHGGAAWADPEGAMDSPERT